MVVQVKTSKEWQDELCPGTTILDPDGWDRQNFEFSFNEELITRKEFWNRLMDSTIISERIEGENCG